MTSPTQPVHPLTTLAGSVVINMLLLAAVANGLGRQPAVEPQQEEIEVERVTIDKDNHTVNVIVPKLVKPQPKEKPQEQKPTEEPKKPQPTPPQPSHNRIETAVSPGPTKPSDPPAVLPGGNAPLGAPTSQQSPGNGTTPNTPVAPTPPVTPPAAPPSAPPAAPPTPPTPTPPPPPPPPPPAPPKPKGISRDAEPISTEQPTIPESLLSKEFKRSVRVRVKIAADGSFTVELRSSCGNADVDKLALDALKRWKWRPKLVDGEPTADVQTFRFEFEVK